MKLTDQKYLPYNYQNLTNHQNRMTELHRISIGTPKLLMQTPIK